MVRLREREVDSKLVISDGEIDNYLADQKNTGAGEEYQLGLGASLARKRLFKTAEYRRRNLSITTFWRLRNEKNSNGSGSRGAGSVERCFGGSES